MATEIERKFLVINDLWREHIESSSVLTQAYITSSKSATVRVRISDDTAYLTIKSATVGISRSEFEYSIPVKDAKELLQLREEGDVIEKTRYRVRCGEHVWDLDIFHGKNEGLNLAEVELSAENESYQMPDWAGEEVSHDHRYKNSNLFKNPYSSWE